MEKNSTFAKVVFALALIATTIGFTAFSQSNVDKNKFQKDQLSKDDDSTKNSKSFRNDAGRSFDQLDLELKQLDLHMHRLNAELKNIDLNKAQKHLDEAMKTLDEQKITAKIDQSMRKINWDKLNQQIQESVAKVDKINMLEVQKEIEKAKAQIETKKLNKHFIVPRIDIKEIRIDAEKAMKNARLSIQKAREEVKSMRAFTTALERDGLIDKSKAYKIEVKEGELYINGKKQSNEVNEKYRQYYKQTNFTINVNGDNEIRI